MLWWISDLKCEVSRLCVIGSVCVCGCGMIKVMLVLVVLMCGYGFLV